jgi:DNA polymerase kappa
MLPAGQDASEEEESFVATEQQDSKPTAEEQTEHDTLKYHLLGPSLTKAGQDTVDQQKVCA